VWRVSVPAREYYIMILYYVSFCIINYTINNYNTSGIIELNFARSPSNPLCFFITNFPFTRSDDQLYMYIILLYTAYACRLRRICIPVCLSRPARTAAAQLHRGAATAATCYNRMCAHRVCYYNTTASFHNSCSEGGILYSYYVCYIYIYIIPTVIMTQYNNNNNNNNNTLV